MRFIQYQNHAWNQFCDHEFHVVKVGKPRLRALALRETVFFHFVGRDLQTELSEALVELNLDIQIVKLAEDGLEGLVKSRELI